VSSIEVVSSQTGGGWVARVTVSDRGSSREFEVTVTRDELARLDPGAAEPAALVRRAFEFLLTREPKELILPRFGLAVISRYFPEFEAEMRA